MDSLTFGAFPRSGNYYFQHLVETVFDSTVCLWLSHRISDWDEKQNKVTVLRDPLKSITSWISTTKDDRVDRAEKVLEWYIAYHTKIKSMGEDIVILPFDFLVSEPLKACSCVAEKYELTMKTDFDEDSVFLNSWKDTEKWDYALIERQIMKNPLYEKAQLIFGDLTA